uniref:Uncharacterized protein n=1 Tax=Biomphalaria glabrata TaxID=6526 RepID=A0A2C9M1X1_BIOGL
MAPPDRQIDKYSRNMPNGHAGHTRQSSHADFRGNPAANKQVSHYQRNSMQVYPAKAVVQQKPKAPVDVEVYSPRVYQNANALEKYQTQEKHHVRQGKHAAAVDQLFENDLHNVHYTKHQHATGKNGLEVLPNGMSAEHQATSDQRYIRRYLNLKVHYDEPRARPSSAVESDASTLHTSFDPMKDRHLWTMWRTAVNGRIVDEVRKLERIKSERGSEASNHLDSSNPGVYGKAIVAPPLKRFIKLDEHNREAAQHFQNLGQGRLETDQFVYYGLPRVYITPSRDTPR